MSRMNVFEFEDFSFTPKIIRNSTTDFLRTVIGFSNIYECIYSDIVDTLEQTNTNTIIDLCSGGGGPQHRLIQYIANESPISSTFESITLTDLYPNLEAFSLLCLKDDKIKSINYSIDATNVPKELKGMRTLFSSFHHLNSSAAKTVLQNCVDSGEPIGVFELTERTFFSIFKFIFLAPFINFILISFTKPFSYKKILIAPIAALTTWWDGIASCCRTYSIKELEHFTQEIDPNNIYEWKIGKKFTLRNITNITYLIGRKK